jgi:hypothetical protein
MRAKSAMQRRPRLVEVVFLPALLGAAAQALQVEQHDAVGQVAPERTRVDGGQRDQAAELAHREVVVFVQAAAHRTGPPGAVG